MLTIPVLFPDDEKKLTYVFIFTLLFGVSKGFHKTFWDTTKESENKNWS